jgi:hypothetical protein
MRHVLNQATNAAAKGGIFEIVYRRSVPRLGHNQVIGAIAHRQCPLIWLILHQRHAGYELSQRKRKRVEQSFGWIKMVGMLRKVKLRGIDKVGWLFTFTGAAYNLCRLRNLMAKA